MTTAPGHLALVVSADERFAFGLAVAVHSALVHLSDPSRIQVFVLDNGLSEKSRKRMQRVASRVNGAPPIRWISVRPEQLRARATGGHWPGYSRLLIPDLLPESFERALYLDADLVVRHDLLPLFSVELNGAPFGAVRDFAIATTAHLSGIPKGIPPKPYFNTGVLVMDLPEWRRLELSQRALDYAAASPHPLAFPDQDALNGVTDGWRQLDIDWNVQLWNVAYPKRLLVTDRAAYFRGRSLYRNARIWHWVGPKPWDPRSDIRGTTQWVRALLASGWYERDEAVVWTLRWTIGKAKAWPGISLRRWRLRMASLVGRH